MPKHSIIVSSYNRPIYVTKCIESIRAQTVPDWEALIADDGSTPETLEAIRKASAGDKRIRLLPCPIPFEGSDRGSVLHRYAERINEALAISSGEILHYVADDDWYDPERLDAFDQLFRDTAVIVGYGRLIYVNQEGTPYGAERFPPGPTREVLWIMDHNQCAHRRSVFEKIPKWPIYPNHHALDALFFAEMAKYWNFVPVDRVVGYKRMHAFNLTNTKQMTTARRE